MRYLVIDPDKRTITEHDAPGGVDARLIRTHTGGWLALGGRFSNGDFLWVDDEGLTDPDRPVWCFHWTGYPAHPLAGVAVVSGPEELPEGATDPDEARIVAARSTGAEVAATIAWMDKPQLVTLKTTYHNEPGRFVTTITPSFRDAP